MSLRARIVVYIVAIHLLMGVVAWIALRERRAWLLAAEALFVLSAFIGARLVKSFFVPLSLIRTGAELLNEQDLSARFREVGQPEMDALIRIYNRMSDQLREDRLRITEQELMLGRVLDASPAGVLVLDFDGRVVLVNPAAARLLGLPAESIRGRDLAAIPSPLAAEAAATAAGPGRVIPHEGRRRIRCQRGAFLDRGFARSFLILEELTEEMRQSERAAYRKLVRMMSHEVNNSAGAVVSLLESCGVMAASLPEPARAESAEALQVAASRMRHLNAFMNGFADLVRLPPPERRPCDLKRLVDDILVLLRPELERRRITIGWSAVSAPGVGLDKNQVEQALVNVILNAIEAIGEEGRIELSLATAPPGRVRLSVKDTGPGIPPDLAAHLFTPFFSSKRNGRGVGLTLVSEILSNHEAAFGLINRPEGGAEFWMEFR